MPRAIPHYFVTYVEVLPTAIAPAAALLKKYRDASFHQDGNLREEALQELDRPNRFAIIEAWRDKAAIDSHAASSATTEFRDQLKAIQAAPYDERVNTALYVRQGARARARVARSTSSLMSTSSRREKTTAWRR